MAFSPETLSLLVQPIGDVGLRIYSYRTDDTEATMIGAGYATNAAYYGLRSADLVIVTPVTIPGSDPYIMSVDTIDADGHATLIISDATGQSVFSGSARIDTRALLTESSTSGGYWSSYDDKGARKSVFINTESVTPSANHIRDGQFFQTVDRDETDYETGGHRGITNAVRGFVTGKNDGAGYIEQWKDLHGGWFAAVGNIGGTARGVAGVLGAAVQVGTGVATNEFAAENPAGSSQAALLCGAFGITASGVAADDSTHLVYGVAASIGGYRNTAAFRAASYTYGGNLGSARNGLQMHELVVTEAGITMPTSSGNQGTIIKYDTGDYSYYDKADDGYYWVIGGSNALKVSADEIVGPQGVALRERLSADRTYYVRTDGSDSNNGLANTAGGAFLTIQKAIDTIRQSIDMNGKNVNIQLADGTYTGAIDVSNPFTGGGVVQIGGNATTPANTIINVTGNAIVAGYGGRIQIANLELRTTTSGSCLTAILNGVISVAGGVRFGACAGDHMTAYVGGQIYVSGDNFITGGAGSHLHAYSQGCITLGVGSTTLSGTPAFSNYFVGVAAAHVNCTSSYSFSGAATGQRFLAHKNGHINAAGAAVTFFPGDVAGVQYDGGRYAGVQGWQSYTPTIACAGSAGFATSSVSGRYLRGDKTIEVLISFTVDNAGGTPGTVTATLPEAAVYNTPGVAYNLNSAGDRYALASGSIVQLAAFGGGAPATAGTSIVVRLSYETSL